MTLAALYAAPMLFLLQPYGVSVALIRVMCSYGARKVALMTEPGEENEGMLGYARRDVRPGEVMREVTDLVDEYKSEEDEAAKQLLRTIASKIVEVGWYSVSSNASSRTSQGQGLCGLDPGRESVRRGRGEEG